MADALTLTLLEADTAVAVARLPCAVATRVVIQVFWLSLETSVHLEDDDKKSVQERHQ